MDSAADTRAESPGGLPHSEIPGSTPARGSPRLFAACHVLPRLLAPRHPPDALVSLDPPAATAPLTASRSSPTRSRGDPDPAARAHGARAAKKKCGPASNERRAQTTTRTTNAAGPPRPPCDTARPGGPRGIPMPRPTRRARKTERPRRGGRGGKPTCRRRPRAGAAHGGHGRSRRPRARPRTGDAFSSPPHDVQRSPRPARAQPRRARRGGRRRPGTGETRSSTPPRPRRPPERGRDGLGGPGPT